MAEGTSSSRVTFGQVLGNRQFLLLWLAQLVSTFGDWLAIVALFSLLAFRWHGSADQVAGIIVAFLVPMVVLGPLAGVFVDRWHVKRTMIASDLIRAVLAALLAFAATPWTVYVLLAALSGVSSFFLPAQNAAIPRLVRREELLVANSLNAQTIQFNKIVGPAIAGFLVAWAGEKLCFYLDAVSFVASAALLSLVALPHTAAIAQKGVRAVLEELRAGLRYLQEHPALRFVTVAMAAAMFVTGTFNAVVAVYVRDILRSGSSVFGQLIAVIGLGAILGAVLMARFAQRQQKVFLVSLGILGMGAGMFLLTLATTALFAVAFSLSLGIAVSFVLVPSQTLVQEETPRQMLGRVSSTSLSVMMVTQLVGVALAGKLAAWMGIRPLYYVLSILLCMIAIAGYAYARASRLTDAKVPAAEL